MKLRKRAERSGRQLCALLRSYNEELGREKEVVLTRVAAHEAKIGDITRKTPICSANWRNCETISPS